MINHYRPCPTSTPPVTRSLIYSAVLGVGLLASDLAQAQMLEEVIVTARKRAESVQDVPMAVSVFTAEQLQNRQVNNIVDLQKMIPNITINETSGLAAGSVQIYIRGIGNDPGFDQGVGIYVDDVYLNRAGGGLLGVYDIERIEVLKGPQGHLYGRNTIGGAIKYITREPSEEVEAGLELKTGTDSLVEVTGNLSGPLGSDKLFGGIGFNVTDRDGYQENQFDGSEWGTRESKALRGTLVWQATDSLSVKFVADYLDDESKPLIPARVAINEEGPTFADIDARLHGANDVYGPGTGIVDEPADLSLPMDEDDVNTAHLYPGFNASSLETLSLSATVDWEINDSWSLKSVTAQREVDYPRSFDFDGSHQVFINTSSHPEDEDFSQEFQLNYSGDHIEAVFGLYYLDAERKTKNPGVTDQRARLRFYDDHYKTTTVGNEDLESSSAYFNVDWNFAEDWELSLGGRYTEDEKTLEQRATVDHSFYAFALTIGPQGIDLLGIAPGQEAFVESHPAFITWFTNGGADSLIERDVGEQPALDSATISRFTQVRYEENTGNNDTWDEFSPSARISYTLKEDVLLYAGFSSGFKSGGFATDGDTATPYDPETVETYVLGFKSTLLNNTVRFNAELFFNDYEDKQLATVTLADDNTLINTRDNVGKVESKGVEVELTWLTPLEGLSFDLNVGYLDSEIDEFIKANDDPDNGIPLGDSINVSDQFELGFQPEWTGAARINYSVDLAVGTVFLTADVAYRDEMYTDSPIDITSDFLSQAWSDSLTTYNALASYTTTDGKWRVALAGKNLSDERTLVNTFNVTDFISGGYNRGRTWELSVGYTY